MKNIWVIAESRYSPMSDSQPIGANAKAVPDRLESHRLVVGAKLQRDYGARNGGTKLAPTRSLDSSIYPRPPIEADTILQS